MTHWISGVIAARPVLERIAASHTLNAPAELHEGLGFLPLDESNLGELVGAVDANRSNDVDDGGAFEHLTPELTRWCAAQSALGPIVYVETRYFGGEGSQGAALFADGHVAWGPANDRAGPINQALSLLGVTASSAHDAFDTVGLGRHRGNDDWRSYPRLADKPSWMR